MELNAVGLTAGLTAFLGIWMGHVLVRKLEYKSTSISLPAACFALIGIFLEIGSFRAVSPLVSVALGILGITTLWDALEFFRQQKRIIKGHAPANPANPRHMLILEQHASATTLDLLKRDPLGRTVNPQEAASLVAGKENAE